MLTGSQIALLIGGSIAAYKSAELVRELTKRGVKVHVVMSEAATKFISPLTLQSLSGNMVTTDLFDEVREAKINHIWLADHPKLVVVAPATADILARAAAGMADDALTTVLLATKAPVLFVPAMNVNMWNHPSTQRNVQTLREFGMQVMPPGEGELACGWIGAGRFPELSDILEHMENLLRAKDLRGSRVVVSAGPTREALDPIRFITNRSSGKMGYALAREAWLRGAQVSLVSGPTSLKPPAGVDFFSVTTAGEMREKIFDLVMQPGSPDGSPAQLVIMAAAPCDHRPEKVSSTKLKHPKTSSYSVSMTPNPDILHELGARRAEIEQASGRPLKLVGFAAETGDEEEMLAWAREKLEKKNTDLMVGNLAEEAFESDTNRVWLLDRGRQEEVATADKQLIAGKIISAALRC